MRKDLFDANTYVEQKLAEEKVFKDPIHKYIHVKDQLIWDLIKTKEFQRLRRIKQLGTLYLSFILQSIVVLAIL